MTNNAVFIDTSALIALVSSEDRHAALAERLITQLQNQRAAFVTSSAVIFELLDGAAMRDHRISSYLRFFLLTFGVEVINVDSELMERAWKLYDARRDKGWSLTDCVSFQVMSERGLTDALTHDHHFEQAGFRALLRPT